MTNFVSGLRKKPGNEQTDFADGRGWCGMCVCERFAVSRESDPIPAPRHNVPLVKFALMCVRLGHGRPGQVAEDFHWVKSNV